MIMMLLNSPDDKALLFVETAGSKSLINRYLILNSIHRQNLSLYPGSECADVMEMLTCLEKLGLHYRLETCSDIPVISCQYQNLKNVSKEILIDVHEAGTVFRFLITRLALEDGYTFRMRVGESLMKRPFLPLVEALQKLGADISVRQNELLIKGKTLEGGKVLLPSDISSQFVSSLLLSASLFKSDLEISFYQSKVQSSLLYSESYIRMTIQMLKQLGIKCEMGTDRIYCENRKSAFTDNEIAVESDYSTAPSFWVLSLITGRKIAVAVSEKVGLQGDLQFITLLKQLGFRKVIYEKSGKQYLAFEGEFSDGIDVSMKDMPDQVMNLAILALFCNTPTVIRDIEILRFKESDRIENLKTGLKHLNVCVQYENEQLLIEPGICIDKPVELCSCNDHRLAMIWMILKQKYPLIKIDNTDCIKKSAPEFLTFLIRLDTDNLRHG